MALLRPSLTLVLDLDERAACEDTVLEIKRSYAHIGTPIVRTHQPESEDEPITNTARALVNMGTRSYLENTDDANALWQDVISPWIGNILHKVGNNMKVFNGRQRRIGLPEVVFSRWAGKGSAQREVPEAITGGQVSSSHPSRKLPARCRSPSRGRSVWSGRRIS